MEILKDVSYIIGYRQSSEDRRLGLQFVLNWLYKFLPEMEILLVEQDAESNIDLKLPPNCKKHFIYNPGLYNRCWAFNVGVKLTDRKILAFADSDMFMDKDDYIRAFEACRTFQAVNPNGQTTYNVVNADVDALTFEISEKRKLWTFAAGLIMMQREAFDLIGGWDERFEGWGGEDDAISHLIYNSLTSKTFDFKMYHVDHARSVFDGKTQPGYLHNRMLFEEITTLSGSSLARFLTLQRNVARGNPDKFKNPAGKTDLSALHFVIAVTTFNRKKYIEEFLTSWEKTKSAEVKWSVIIADDGSVDGTLDYLDHIEIQGVDIFVLKNKRLGIAGQTNTIIDQLMTLQFDVCFCCNDDILFTREGWDFLYYDVLNRTGYDHLCYFDTKWSPKNNLPEPYIRGQLINSCLPENVQGCFFTLTPSVIKNIGYFDTAHFGFRGLAHVDFTWRCCRGGFNVPASPFDVLNSNDYIETQKENYIYSIPGPLQSVINSEGEKKRKWKIIRMNRLFIPKSEINVMPEVLEKHEKGEETDIMKLRKQYSTPTSAETPEAAPENETKAAEEQPVKESGKKIPGVIKTPSVKPEIKTKHYVYLDTEKSPSIHILKIENALKKEAYTYAKEKDLHKRGTFGINGSLSKKLYNFCLHYRIHFPIRLMDKIANKMIKTGVNIKNIDN